MEAADRMGMAMSWNTSDPHTILDGPQMIRANQTDAKVYRAYGQLKLLRLVNAKAHSEEKEYKSVLHIRACAKAEFADPKKKKKQSVDRYGKEYLYEGTWSKVAELFGGEGIVLVFVDAAMYISDHSQYFYNISRSIDALGPDALESHCTHGRLTSEYIAMIEEAKANVPYQESEVEDSSTAEDEGGDEEEYKVGSSQV